MGLPPASTIGLRLRQDRPPSSDSPSTTCRNRVGRGRRPQRVARPRPRSLAGANRAAHRTCGRRPWWGRTTAHRSRSQTPRRRSRPVPARCTRDRSSRSARRHDARHASTPDRRRPARCRRRPRSGTRTGGSALHRRADLPAASGACWRPEGACHRAAGADCCRCACRQRRRARARISAPRSHRDPWTAGCRWSGHRDLPPRERRRPHAPQTRPVRADPAPDRTRSSRHPPRSIVGLQYRRGRGHGARRPGFGPRVRPRGGWARARLGTAAPVGTPASGRSPVRTSHGARPAPGGKGCLPGRGSPSHPALFWGRQCVVG